MTVFALGDINELLAELDATPEGSTDSDEVPQVQADAISKLGDVWLLGKHRIMCGDSTDAGSVALLLNGRKAALMQNDPPYGIAYVANAQSKGQSVAHADIENDDLAGEKSHAFL